MGDTTEHGKSVEGERAEELALYERLRAKVGETLGKLRDTITGEAVANAVDKAAAELKEAGQHSRETVTRLADTMKKDLASTSEAMRPRLESLKADAGKATQELKERGGAFWHEAVQEGGHLAALSRDKGGAAVVQVARSLGEWSQHLGDRLDQMLVYHTGELTHGGEFRCESCGGSVQLKTAGHLPPCPKCHKTRYRRA